MNSPDPKAYRPDIDGLRAIAVIPVILFHAGLGGFSGGYVGVDVFFVISGYLITGILLREIGGRDFSIQRFYGRRVRRIFPALFTLLFAVAVAGWFLLLPGEYNDLGNALAAATFFYSNYHFMAGAGYFAAPAETQALLHTWSLAVEEQFYIVFPVFLYLVTRSSRGRAGPAIAALALLSLAYSMVLVALMPESAFYSTPARGWELLLGALLAAYPRWLQMSARMAELMAASGLAAILAAAVFFSPQTAFPGAAALLPCLGAAAIIHAGGSHRGRVAWLLSTPALRLPGLMSYSLYLWHWPVLVFYKLYVMRPPGKVETGLLLLVIVVLSWLSWRFVETPFRQRRVLAEQGPLLAAGAGVMLVTLACGVALSRLDGVPARFPASINRVLAAQEDRAALTGCGIQGDNSGPGLRVCPVGARDASPASFAVWGDSHGEAMLPAIDAAARHAGLAGVYLGRDGCLPLLGAHQVHEGYASCVDHADAVMEYLAAHPAIAGVFLVSRWAIYASGMSSGGDSPLYIRDPATLELSLAENRAVFRRSFARTMARLRELGLEVMFVEQVPEAAWSVPDAIARDGLFRQGRELRLPLADHMARQQLVAGLIAAGPGAAPGLILQPWKPMCGDLYCAVMKDGIPLYRDSSHITRAQALSLAAVFEPGLRHMALAAAGGAETAGSVDP